VTSRGTDRRRGEKARDRNIRRMTASVSVSALGTWSYNVGIAVYAYRATQSTSWVAAATVGRYVPALLLTWVGSHWIDHFPRRTVAVLADLVCAAAMVLITVTAVAKGPLVVAIALAAISSAAARVQGSAALSVAADIVVESQLVKSTVLMSTAEAVATAVGPALASAVLAVYSPSVLFAANAVTFLVSAFLLRGVDAARARRPAPASTGKPQEVAYKASCSRRPGLVVLSLPFGCDEAMASEPGWSRPSAWRCMRFRSSSSRRAPTSARTWQPKSYAALAG
jgi:MFS family permease